MIRGHAHHVQTTKGRIAVHAALIHKQRVTIRYAYSDELQDPFANWQHLLACIYFCAWMCSMPIMRSVFIRYPPPKGDETTRCPVTPCYQSMSSGCLYTSNGTDNCVLTATYRHTVRIEWGHGLCKIMSLQEQSTASFYAARRILLTELIPVQVNKWNA